MAYYKPISEQVHINTARLRAKYMYFYRKGNMEMARMMLKFMLDQFNEYQ